MPADGAETGYGYEPYVSGRRIGGYDGADHGNCGGFPDRSDICIDLHASDIFVREIPQVRLSEDFAEALLPYAKMTNADMIWMNATPRCMNRRWPIP